jgi:hypothetical protein
MTKGRTLRLFLVDGTSSGLITAELGNWSGKALVAPRTRVSELLKRPEAAKTGVYLLVGPDPDAATRSRVYVGESDNVGDRLKSHEKTAGWDFSKLVFFVSKDENITKGHVRYLESRLIQTLSQSPIVKLMNATAPQFSLLPEAEIADMDGFLECVLTLLPVLGFDLLTNSAPPVSQTSVTFELKTSFVTAKAQERDDEFVVLAGSFARKEGVPSWPNGTRALRDSLVADGRLAPTETPDLYRFTQDTGFSSPSAAASVVTARPEQGPAVWKVAGSKTTYGEWRASQVESITSPPSS